MNANETMLWTAPTFRPVIPRVAFRDVLVAQLWMLWDGRRVAVLVVSMALAMFIPVQFGDGMMPFMAGIHVTVLLAAVLWGAVVWHAQEPGRRMEHREAPVPFATHDAARTLAGLLLFAGAYGIIAVASAFERVWIWPANGTWLHVAAMLAGLVAAYMLGSAAGMALRNPIAGIAIFTVGYILIQEILPTVLERPVWRAVHGFYKTYGLDVAMAGPVALQTQGRWSPASYSFLGPGEWLKAVLLWTAVSILLFLLALRLRRT